MMARTHPVACWPLVACSEVTANIRKTATKIANACKQIRHSEGFAGVLQRLLIVGNAMNEGEFSSA